MGKLSPYRIIKEHFKTLYLLKNGEKVTSKRDVAIQLFLPVFLVVVAYFFGFTMKSQLGLLSGMSILATLLGAVAVFVFQIRIQLRQNMDSLMTEDDIALIDELFFNILWIILMGFIQSSLLIISEAAGLVELDLIWRIVSAVSVALSVNVVLTLLMVLKRLARVYTRVGMHLQ